MQKQITCRDATLRALENPNRWSADVDRAMTAVNMDLATNPMLDPRSDVANRTRSRHRLGMIERTAQERSRLEAAVKGAERRFVDDAVVETIEAHAAWTSDDTTRAVLRSMSVPAAGLWFEFQPAAMEDDVHTEGVLLTAAPGTRTATVFRRHRDGKVSTSRASLVVSSTDGTTDTVYPEYHVRLEGRIGAALYDAAERDRDVTGDRSSFHARLIAAMALACVAVGHERPDVAMVKAALDDVVSSLPPRRETTSSPRHTRLGRALAALRTFVGNSRIRNERKSRDIIDL